MQHQLTRRLAGAMAFVIALAGSIAFDKVIGNAAIWAVASLLLLLVATAVAVAVAPRRG
jgi:hypothetical protein